MAAMRVADTKRDADDIDMTDAAMMRFEADTLRLLKGSAVYNSRSARLVLALSLVWLVFLVYPIILLFQAHVGLVRLLIVIAGGVLFAAVYVWAVVRAVASTQPRPQWLALTVLTILAFTPPLIYGGDWVGGVIYVSIVAGLTLPLRKALLMINSLMVLTVLTAIVTGTSWWQALSITSITGFGGCVMFGIHWLSATNQELHAARVEIARLAASEERVRLARDLHDSVKQQVFVTSMEVGAARTLLNHDPQGAAAHLAEASAVIHQVQTELHGLISELRPTDAPDGPSLAAALREYVVSWSRRSGISVSLQVSGEREMPVAVQRTLFRVTQEALTNAEKHSGATRATIDMAWEDDHVILCIADTGCGFVPAERAGKGYGLRTMRERVEALSGQITIESAPGSGTHITCVCPLSAAGAANGEKERQTWAWASR